MTAKTRLPQSKRARRKAKRIALRDKTRYCKRESRLASSIKQLERYKENLSDKERAVSESLINTFLNGYLTQAQKSYVRGLVKRAVPSNGETYIYLITDDASLKIGISSTPDKRLKDLQVSNPKTLTLLSKTMFATRGKAKLSEKILHKKCKRFNLSGEWFSLEAINVCREYFKGI